MVKLPVNLWGRDIQQQLGLQLTNEYSPESQTIMRKQGYFPSQGLGKHLQGIKEPIEPSNNYERQGLGFS